MLCTGCISLFVYLFILYKQADTCDIGYWLTQDSWCKLCPTNCDHCTNSTHCTKCKSDFWDIRTNMACGSPCRETCTSSGCNDTTGHCYGCLPDSYGIYCEHNCNLCLNWSCGRRKCTNSCIEGYYEEAESDFQCRKCFKNCTLCNSQTECLRCPRGFHLFRYVSNNYTICVECPPACEACVSFGECTACRPGKHGSTCSKDCNISNCKQCFEIDSVAICTECRSGYTLQNGDCILGTNVCSRYCSTNCESSGICLDDCINGWTGPKCMDKCVDKCRKCDQSDGNKCEICKGNNYATTYDKPCNTHCLTLPETVTCNINNGTCLNGCEDDYWDDKCENRCYEGCNSVSCDRHDGHCDVCYRKYYGTACQKRCNEQCFDDNGSSEICYKINGTCVYGCKDGYRGYTCEDELSSNYPLSPSRVPPFPSTTTMNETTEITERVADRDQQHVTAIGVGTGKGFIVVIVLVVVIACIMKRRLNVNRSRNDTEERAYVNTAIMVQAVPSRKTEGGVQNVAHIQTNETDLTVYERLDYESRDYQCQYSGLERQRDQDGTSYVNV